MENHPIPQDVTGFKFKLIGSVTLKQFLYILGGGILAIICYVLPVSPFIKLPLAFFFGGMGVMLAFVPIEGRPMDVMLKNFLKALPAENQYIFKKRGADALITDFFTPNMAAIKVEEVKKTDATALDSKRALLYKTLRQNGRPDDKEQETLTNINSFLHDASTSITPPIQHIDNIPADAPESIQIATPTVTIRPQAADFAPVDLPQSPIDIVLPKEEAADSSPQVVINTQTVNNINPPQPIPTVAPPAPEPMQPEPAVIPAPVAPTPPPVILQQEPVAQPIPAQPEPVASIANPIQTPVAQTAEPIAESPLQTVGSAPQSTGVAPNTTNSVTSVGPEQSLKAGFPQLPDTPNIVLGIIKDPRGRVLPNILVEFMNQQGIPVRAFKSNALGQFAAATPLSNGEYIVALEDPRKLNEFEQIKIVLDGKIFQPLEIISVDQREKLRRELFGQNTQSIQATA